MRLSGDQLLRNVGRALADLHELVCLDIGQAIDHPPADLYEKWPFA
jgi:hypothetical protein